jgi:5-methylcytosine-specific restriction protein B
MVFKPRDGIFKKLCQDAAKTPDRPHYLIIDEINRGDVPRIFGELMTVLELDKRDQKILLPLAAGVLSVPRNLYIIGTMNTADRSIALLDAALRRRFAFVELMPDPTLLRHLQAGPLGLAEWLAALNQRLRMHLAHDGRSRQVGHAYLLTALPVSSVAAFARVLRDEIVPLLQEYCGDEFIILQETLGTGLVDAAGATIRHDLFEPNREDDLVAAVMTGLEISGAIAPGSDQDEQENVDAPA